MKLHISLVICLLAIGQWVSAQEPMSLATCRQKAIAYNKDLQNADLQQQEAQANQKAARTAYLPAISASLTSMYLPGLDNFNQPGGFLPTAANAEAAAQGQFTGLSDVWMPGIEVELDNLLLVMGGLDVSQPIYTGGKIKYTNKKAQAGVEITKQAYALKYSQLIEKTDQAYWNVVAIQAQVKLTQKYVDMLAELEEQMTQMHEIGLSPKSEQLKVSVKKNEAELNLLKAKNGLKIAQMYLNQTIGQPLDTPLHVSDSLQMTAALIDFSAGTAQALAQRNELNMLAQQVKLAQYDKKLALADYLPQLGLSVGYSTYYVNNLIEDISFNPQISAQLNIPIFKWGQGLQKQKAARLKIKQAETTLSNTSELISLEVQRTKIQLEEAYQAILIAQKNIEKADESLAETQESFKVGLNTTSDLLNANAAWQAAQAQLIQSLANYEVLKTTWQKVTGNLKPQE